MGMRTEKDTMGEVAFIFRPVFIRGFLPSTSSKFTNFIFFSLVKNMFLHISEFIINKHAHLGAGEVKYRQSARFVPVNVQIGGDRTQLLAPFFS